MNPKVWEASGHVATFADVMVEDSVTNKRYRADHLIEDYFAAKGDDTVVDGMSAEQLQQIIDQEGIVSPDGNPFGECTKIQPPFRN